MPLASGGKGAEGGKGKKGINEISASQPAPAQPEGVLMNTGQDGQMPGRIDPATGLRVWALDKVGPTSKDDTNTKVWTQQACECGLLTCASANPDEEEVLEVMKILGGWTLMVPMNPNIVSMG